MGYRASLGSVRTNHFSQASIHCSEYAIPEYRSRTTLLFLKMFYTSMRTRQKTYPSCKSSGTFGLYSLLTSKTEHLGKSVWSIKCIIRSFIRHIVCSGKYLLSYTEVIGLV
jgi:hypothetical protein